MDVSLAHDVVEVLAVLLVNGIADGFEDGLVVLGEIFAELSSSTSKSKERFESKIPEIVDAVPGGCWELGFHVLADTVEGCSKALFSRHLGQDFGCLARVAR